MNQVTWVELHGHRVAVWDARLQPSMSDLEGLVSSEARSKSQGMPHDGRRREWLASRALSNFLIGREPGETAIGYPLWPQGWSGSITHKGGHVGLWVMQHAFFHGGVDLELLRDFEPGLAEKIMSEKEMSLASRFISEGAGSLVFAAKEAIYKALCPLVGRKFYFEAVYLDEVSGGSGQHLLRFVVTETLSERVKGGADVVVSAKAIKLDGVKHWLALALFR
jgi:4'-phosphopantetheinyl transferase EntD